jgi:hypothetical protein
MKGASAELTADYVYDRTPAERMLADLRPACLSTAAKTTFRVAIAKHQRIAVWVVTGAQALAGGSRRRASRRGLKADGEVLVAK